MCVKLQPPGGTIVTAPSGLAFSGLWAIPSTESGPQPLLVTYNLSSLALTPGLPGMTLLTFIVITVYL